MIIVLITTSIGLAYLATIEYALKTMRSIGVIFMCTLTVKTFNMPYISNHVNIITDSILELKDQFPVNIYILW